MNSDLEILVAAIAFLTVLASIFIAAWLQRRKMNALFDQFERRIHERFDAFEQQVHERFDAFEHQCDQGLLSIEHRLESLEHDLDNRLNSVEQSLDQRSSLESGLSPGLVIPRRIPWRPPASHPLSSLN